MAIARTTCQPVHTHTGCHALATAVTPIPYRLVPARLVHRVDQPHHFLTEQVVDGQLDVGALRHFVADCRGRVERVREAACGVNEVGVAVSLPEKTGCMTVPNCTGMIWAKALEAIRSVMVRLALPA